MAKVALLPGPEGQNGRIVCGSFRAAIPAQVLVRAVLVALAVGRVMLLVVTDQVMQREAVVGRHVVDAGMRPAAPPLIEVAAAGQTERQAAHLVAVPLPEAAHGVPVGRVPFSPEDREVPDLIPALAEIPRFGNQFHLRQHRVLVDDIKERPQPIDLVEFTRQRRGQVEPEAIHVHLQHPVPQTVHNELERARVGHVQGIATAGVVHIVAAVVGHQTVVRGVIDAPETEGGPRWFLAGVIVDHVEDHLDALAVQGLDHGLELGHLLPQDVGAGIAGVGAKKPIELYPQ